MNILLIIYPFRAADTLNEGHPAATGRRTRISFTIICISRKDRSYAREKQKDPVRRRGMRRSLPRGQRENRSAGELDGNPDDCPNPRAVSGGTFLHDAFPFVPGVFAGTELYGAEMMSDPGLLSTGIWSPNEDALLREKDKHSSGGRNAEFTASRRQSSQPGYAPRCRFPTAKRLPGTK